MSGNGGDSARVPLLGAGVLLMAVLSGASAQDLGTRLAPDDLRRFEYDVEQADGRAFPPAPTRIRSAGSTEVAVVRMAQQYGLAYLPLMVARQYRLIEQHGRLAGLPTLRVTWSRFPSAVAMRDALLTGFLDFAVGGMPALLTMWDQSRTKREVRGVAALSAMPLFLNTNSQRIAAVEDFGEADRIALPAERTSTQAIVLQMAIADRRGFDHYDALDAITVGMPHPLALRALLARKDGVTAHFGSPPYQYQELEAPGIRTLLSSYDVLGGRSTLSVMWTRGEFYEETPRVLQAVYDGLKAAMRRIEAEPAEAARIYLLQSNVQFPVERIEKMIADPLMRFSVVPENVPRFAEFMYETGAISEVPARWQELFFPLVHADASAPPAE